MAVAERVGKALARLRPHVDRPDGLIDGQPAQQVLVGVIGHGVRMLTDACLPNELERRAADGLADRGFGLRRSADGSGWHVTDGDLDLATGELLHTVLQAELTVDEQSPGDTAEDEQLRQQGWQAALRRLLDSGVLGLRDKVAPHLNVVLGIDLLHGAPGALPAVAASGAVLPASLVRSWWCDSAATRFVLSLGHRVIEASHTSRTLKSHERAIKHLESSGRCQAAGCRCGPGRRLIPHHADPWAGAGPPASGTSCGPAIRPTTTCTRAATPSD